MGSLEAGWALSFQASCSLWLPLKLAQITESVSVSQCLCPTERNCCPLCHDVCTTLATSQLVPWSDITRSLAVTLTAHSQPTEPRCTLRTPGQLTGDALPRQLLAGFTSHGCLIFFLTITVYLTKMNSLIPLAKSNSSTANFWVNIRMNSVVGHLSSVCEGQAPSLIQKKKIPNILLEFCWG